MQCANCNHTNQEGGNFCENCGSPLKNQAAQESAFSTSSTAATAAEPNPYIESTKKISKMYFRHFIDVLKRPYSNSKNIDGQYLVHAIITIILYSLIIPLMFYFGLKGLLNDWSNVGSDWFGEEVAFNPPFTDIVVKPTFAYAIFILLLATFTFASVKLGRANATYKDVISRFGSFLIPFVAILLIALIMSILKIDLFVLFLFIGFSGSILMVPPFVIMSFKRESDIGLDSLYGTLITYLLTFIALLIMGDMLFDAIKSAFSNSFGIFSDLY